MPRQCGVLGWLRLDVCSSGVLFARQSAIAAMTGHRGRHSNCQTQGKTSPTQFQPSCSSSSSSSSSSSLHGHRNSSPWVSCPASPPLPTTLERKLILFSKTASSWRHDHQINSFKSGFLSIHSIRFLVGQLTTDWKAACICIYGLNTLARGLPVALIPLLRLWISSVFWGH